MKIKDLENVVYSQRGNMLFGVVYDLEANEDVVYGATVDHIVQNYGECELNRITADNNMLVFYI